MSSHDQYQDYPSPSDQYQDEAAGYYPAEEDLLATPTQTVAPSLPIISVTSSDDPSSSEKKPDSGSPSPSPASASGSGSGSGSEEEDSEDSGSDTETESSKKMSASRSSKHKSSSSSKKHHHSSSSSSSSKPKSDDWTEVTDAEERRRIQNRIAQRKFREKARVEKERAERDARNREHADSSYRIPSSDELGGDDNELSGLPWGGPNMRYVMAKGHESSSSQQGSRRASDQQASFEEPQYLNPYVTAGYGHLPGSWDGRESSGSGGEEGAYYDYESPYYYEYPTSGGSSTR